MEAHTRSPRDLFEGKEHYEIPPFQRPYVWTEEDQWQPLWNDMPGSPRQPCGGKGADREADVGRCSSHFLGAVVCEAAPKRLAGDPAGRRSSTVSSD